MIKCLQLVAIIRVASRVFEIFRHNRQGISRRRDYATSQSKLGAICAEINWKTDYVNGIDASAAGIILRLVDFQRAWLALKTSWTGTVRRHVTQA